jgi:hypothetical protein
MVDKRQNYCSDASWFTKPFNAKPSCANYLVVQNMTWFWSFPAVTSDYTFVKKLFWYAHRLIISNISISSSENTQNSMKDIHEISSTYLQGEDEKLMLCQDVSKTGTNSSILHRLLNIQILDNFNILFRIKYD